MKEYYTFGRAYSTEKYNANAVTGFRRVKMDLDKAWYGGNVKYVMKQNDGPLIIFVGEKGTLDAGVYYKDLDNLPLDLLRVIYSNTFGKDKKGWGKAEMLGKLTGKPVA